jgi:adenine-specific DNA-methyltransferase
VGKARKGLKFRMPYENIAQTFNIEMGITDVWTDIDFYKEEGFHRAQKPVKLIERIIKASTNEGMVVLDPFLGSGSTAIACLNLNRHYIGIEKDKGYVEVAESRIKKASDLNIRNRGNNFNSSFLDPIFSKI